MAADRAFLQQSAAVAVGGALGSLARYGVGVALPHASGEFPWATVVVNVSGAALMGLLTAWVLARHAPYHLVRPFLGTGVLGGWTTFSALTLDLHQLLAAESPVATFAYLAVTLAGGLLGLVAALGLGRRLWGRAPA